MLLNGKVSRDAKLLSVKLLFEVTVNAREKNLPEKYFFSFFPGQYLIYLI